MEIDLSRITCPATVVSGGLDLAWFRVVADHLVAELPRAVHIDLLWAGHLPILDRPVDTTQLPAPHHPGGSLTPLEPAAGRPRRSRRHRAVRSGGPSAGRPHWSGLGVQDRPRAGRCVGGATGSAEGGPRSGVPAGAGPCARGAGTVRRTSGPSVPAAAAAEGGRPPILCPHRLSAAATATVQISSTLTPVPRSRRTLLPTSAPKVD